MTNVVKNKISKKASAMRRGEGKNSLSKASKASASSSGSVNRLGITITEFELFYEHPRSDEEILTSIRENYLEANRG